jgi:hypothetical protein
MKESEIQFENFNMKGRYVIEFMSKQSIFMYVYMYVCMYKGGP